MELFHQEAQPVSNSMCQHLSALNPAYQQLNHSRSYYNLLEMTCDKMVFDQKLEPQYCRGGQGEEVSRCKPTFCQQLLVRYKTILLPLHSQPHAIASSHSEYVHFQTPLHLGGIEQQNVYITAECCMLSSGVTLSMLAQKKCSGRQANTFSPTLLPYCLCPALVSPFELNNPHSLCKCPLWCAKAHSEHFMWMLQRTRNQRQIRKLHSPKPRLFFPLCSEAYL